MIRLLTFTSVLVFSIVTQAVAQYHSNPEKEIRAILVEQITAWNNGNLEHFMDGYAKFDSLRFASNGTVTYGWITMLQRYKKNYSTKEMMGTLTFSDITLDLLSDEVALVFGKWSLHRAKDQPWGLFTFLFRNTHDGWRIIHDHTSSGN